MNYYPQKKTILSITDDGVNTAQTGDSYQIRTTDSDEVSSDRQDFKVFFHTEQSGGTTSPTVQAHVQTSWDKTNWSTIASSTQLTADGSNDEVKPGQTFGPFVRVVTELGGATLPDHKATVLLVSNARFRTSKVS